MTKITPVKLLKYLTHTGYSINIMVVAVVIWNLESNGRERDDTQLNLYVVRIISEVKCSGKYKTGRRL